MRVNKKSKTGLIETMRYEDGGVFLLNEHLRRLSSACRALGLRPPSPRVVRGAIGRLVRKSPLNRSRLRLIWSCEGGAMRLVLTSFPLTVPPASGYKVMLERRRRFKITPLSSFKTTRRAFYEALYTRARHRGFDEALFFNTRGALVEGTRTNVFLVVNACLVTPALSCGCLPGVTRKAVLRLARRLKIPVKETALSLKDLSRCEEAFVTNAVIGILPVCRIGPRDVPGVSPGPVTRRLLTSYGKAVEAKAVKV